MADDEDERGLRRIMDARPEYRAGWTRGWEDFAMLLIAGVYCLVFASCVVALIWYTVRVMIIG